MISKSKTVQALALLLTLTLFVSAATVQMPRLDNLPTNVYQWETLPIEVPTSATAVCDSSGLRCDRDIWVVLITLTNTNAASRTCTITDNQGTPVPLFDDTIFGKGSGSTSHYVMPYIGGRWMPAGAKWNCSGAGVKGYMKATTLGK